MEVINGHDPSKRNFLRLAGTGAAGLAIGGVIAPISAPGTPEPSCGVSKNADFYINLAVNTLNQLSPLLPNSAAVIAKGVKVLADLKADYDKGDFTNASALLADLKNVMQQIQDDANLHTATEKTIFAIASIAIQAVATFIVGNQPAVSVAKGVLKAEQMSFVERLGSQARADAVFNAAKF